MTNHTRIPNPAQEVNHALAMEFREQGGAEKGHCWRNSVVAMAIYDSPGEIVYVEGWLMLLESEYAIEHGWLQVDGKVVDVTLAGEYPAESYYGVFAYGFADVQKAVRRERGILPFYARKRAGRDAMRAAYAHLPLDHMAALLWAYTALLQTGIRSVIILDE